MITAKIKFADAKSTQYGEKLKLKCQTSAGGEVEVWVSATHKDQASLKPGATILIDDSEAGKYKYVGLAPTTPATSTTTTQTYQSSAPGVTVRQIVDTYAAIYDYVQAEARFANEDAEGRRTIAATLFIQCGKSGAWVTKSPKPATPAPAPATAPDPDPAQGEEDDLPF